MVGNPRFRKREKPPTDKGFRELYDLARHTQKTFRRDRIADTIQPRMVQEARRHIFAAYKKGGVKLAEKVHTHYLETLGSWISQKTLSAEEAKAVGENLESFITAVRKK